MFRGIKHMKDVFSTSKLMDDLNTMFSTPEVDPAKLVYKAPKEQKLENSDFDAEPILKLLDIVKSGVERYSNSSNKKNTSYLRNNLLVFHLLHLVLLDSCVLFLLLHISA